MSVRGYSGVKGYDELLNGHLQLMPQPADTGRVCDQRPLVPHPVHVQSSTRVRTAGFLTQVHCCVTPTAPVNITVRQLRDPQRPTQYRHTLHSGFNLCPVSVVPPAGDCPVSVTQCSSTLS